MFGGIILRLYLRPIQEDDGKLIVKWHNSPIVLDRCLNKGLITEESNSLFFKKYILTGKYKQFIVEKIIEPYGVASYSIATVYLKDIDQYNQRCEMCMFTSYEEEWNSECKRMAIELLLEKAFFEYGMRKIYTFVNAKYKEDVECLKGIGFYEECILKDEVIDSAGNPNDVLRMCMFSEKC